MAKMIDFSICFLSEVSLVCFFCFFYIVFYFSFTFQVPGNFHVSTHAADNQPDVIDMAHIIHKIRFGVERNDTSVSLKED